MRIAVIPSNQHLNRYSGLGGKTEEGWAMLTCAWVWQTLNERGAEAKIFHMPGQGADSVDELRIALDKAVAFNADYWLSVHSDAVGDARQTGVLMLMPTEASRSEGKTLGTAIARNISLPYKGTWVYGQEARKIMYLRRLRERNIRGSLVEVGEHATAAEAKWNWLNAKHIGIGIANALADHLGLGEAQEEEEDMTDAERRLLKEVKLSTVAQSWDAKIIKAMLDPLASPDTVRDLEAGKVQAVAAKRQELGL